MDLRDLDRVAKWFEDNLDSGPEIEELAVRYTGGLANRKPDELVLERLVQIPRDEGHRAKIIADFVGPSKRDGQLVLRNPPKLLRRMIEVAQLSEGERERLLTVVETTPFQGS